MLKTKKKYRRLVKEEREDMQQHNSGQKERFKHKLQDELSPYDFVEENYFVVKNQLRPWRFSDYPN